MPSTNQINNYEDFTKISSKFPHIASKLEILWGSYEYTMYIMDVLMDSRDGERKGLPMDVASALVTLSEIHDIYYPEHAVKSSLDYYN